MMEHAGIHREPVALALCQKAQISCISSQTVSLGLKIPLSWSFSREPVTGKSSAALH